MSQVNNRTFSSAGQNNPPLPLVTLAIVFSLLAAIPVSFIAVITFELGWQAVVTLLFRPRIGELLINTLLLIVVTLPLCALLGVTLAWLTERSSLPGRRLWSVLLATPLAIPAFVQSYSWVSVIPGMHGLSAGVFLSVITYLPFVYLPVAAMMRRLDPALEEVAATLELSTRAIFFRVVLPQLRLAIVGGLLLIGLHLLAEYGLFAMIRFDTFTTAIFDQFQSTFNGPAAHMLASVLSVCCLALLMAENYSRGRSRFARIGSGAARPMRFYQGSKLFACFASLLPLIMTLFALGIPLVTLTRWLWLGGAGVWQQPDLLDALQQTLLLALKGTVLTIIAALPLAWLSVRYPRRLYAFLESFHYLASSLPGIVVALALVSVTIHFARPLYQTEFTVLLAYLLMVMPRALVNVRAGIAQVPVELENVAASLGRSPGRVLIGVTLRLAAPGVAAGSALVLLAINNELTATLLLAPNGTRTLATGFWALTSEIDYINAAPYALLLIAISLPLTGFLYRQSQKLVSA